MDSSNYSSTDSKTSSEDDLIDDGQIDPEILKILGIDDVFDLDQGDYMSLLKERMVKGSFDEKQKLSEEDLAKLSNERKRIRDKPNVIFTSKTINKNSFFNRNSGVTEESNKIVDPKKILPPAGRIKPNDIDEVNEKTDDEIKSELESLKDFLKTDLFEAIKSIGATVKNIESLLGEKNEALKNESELNRRELKKDKSKEKEDRLEGKDKEKSKFGGILSKVVKPFTGLFDTIQNFLMNVLIGSLLNWLISIFQDPKQLLQPIQNLLDGIFNFFDNIIEWLDSKFVGPIRSLIDVVNSGISGFIDILNNALSLIPGTSPIEAPEISNIPERFKLEAPDIIGRKESSPQQSPDIQSPDIQQANSGGIILNKNLGGSITKQNITNNSFTTNTNNNTNNTNTNNSNENYSVYDPISDKGGRVTSETGLTIKGLEPDTQLTALKKDEFVLVPGAARALGIGNLNNLNKKYAGSLANKEQFSNFNNVQILQRQGGGGIDLWGISPSRNVKLSSASDFSQVPAHHRSYSAFRGAIPADYAIVRSGVNPAAVPNHGRGLPVTSGVSGKVIFSGYAGSAGNMVEIGNSRGQKSIRLLHLDKIKTKTGASVSPSTIIGTQGNTGTRDIHVHVDGNRSVHSNWIRSTLGGRYSAEELGGESEESGQSGELQDLMESTSTPLDSSKFFDIVGDPSNKRNLGFKQTDKGLRDTNTSTNVLGATNTSNTSNTSTNVLGATNISKINYNIQGMRDTLVPVTKTSGGTSGMMAKFTPSTKGPKIPSPPSSSGSVKMLPIPPIKKSGGNGNNQVKSGALTGGQGSSVPNFSSVNISEQSHLGAVSSVLGVMEN
jgi:murein DD-endopeptidase MepM/ murein hydrolase activator NlpD